MSPEQAWECIVRGERLTDLDPRWANIETEGDRLVHLIRIEDDEE